jgi:GSCFA family protein
MFSMKSRIEALVARLRSTPEPDQKPPAGVELGRLRAAASAKEGRIWKQHSWHSGRVNKYPTDRGFFEDDLRAVIGDVTYGHVPSDPPLSAGDTVVALGSCFASELRDYLATAGVGAGTFLIPEGLNNTFAIHDFVSWSITGQETNAGFRYDRFEGGEIREWKPVDEQAAYAERFAQAGAFVFTLGLAEVWEDRVTGGVFWRGIPAEMFDAERYSFRLTTVEENAANVERIVELIRRVNPDAPIVLTLSPVPLKATFRPISCITADCVSKSTLRVALDRVMAMGLDGVYYWPSFEVVRWVGGHLPWPAYGLDDDKSRHVSRILVAEIIDAFIAAFYVPDAVEKLRRGSARAVPSATRSSVSATVSALASERSTSSG